MNPLTLARPGILALHPYSSARMEASAGAVWLNANESPWRPYGTTADWNRYPDPQPAALLARLADLYGVRADQVLVGRGSDEGIDLLVRAFCAAGRDAILISPPTFGMYAVSARIQGAGVVEVPLRADFAMDADAVLAAAAPGVKLVFVCAPNNPTGAAVPRDAILRLAEGLDGRALVVVDEAYVEFAGDPAGSAGVADRVGAVSNLVVLRTLSKAWGLAGARIGSVLADPRVIALLRKIQPPYPLPAPSVAAALAALGDGGRQAMAAHRGQVLAERARMSGSLAALPCVRAVLPSEANFLTVRFDDPAGACAALAAEGVIVRDVRHYPMLGDALRITLGTREQDDQVLAILRRVRGHAAAAPLRPAARA